MPNRVQLRRTKGWRLPPNTVVVSRPSRFGNPFRVGCCEGYTRYNAVEDFRAWVHGEIHDVFGKAPSLDEIRHELRGKNLACWCKLDAPCHADVLLDIANA